MNRKGKKSPLARVKASKSNLKQPEKSVKLPKQIKPKAKGVAAKNPRLRNNLEASKNKLSSNSPGKNKRFQQQKSRSPLWLAVYAVAIAVGLSTILGTTISLANSFKDSVAVNNSPTASKVSANSQNKAKLENLFAIASLGKEINPLKLKLENLVQQYPELEPEFFLVDLDTKGFVSIEGDKSISSASTIKLPIVVAFLQDVDQGKIGLDEQLTMTKDVIGDGSGNMRYEKPGSKFSALETVTKMMTISDNTATNMLIKRLGGMEALNQRFAKMKLTQTRLRNPLPDLAGTNTTSAEDLGNLLAKIDSGDLLSLRARDRLLHIMGNIVNDSLLPQGLEPEALIAHKTGDIKSVLADVGMIDMPNGKRYIASIFVKRPDNSSQALELIQEVSRQTYQYFQHP
ncbi:serine hydrolase [Pleurocapsa sp. FMAR1]|uniref:serine hydrolase n=1 Tax=Pleurocapsa sp. FMAR1 TaxID=3040204 RepID=UPI0029C85675|nr:serine hydrolase [Pleurocapsa sp. FMAR1]